jgi:hypothetical protein
MSETKQEELVVISLTTPNFKIGTNSTTSTTIARNYGFMQRCFYTCPPWFVILDMFVPRRSLTHEAWDPDHI